MNISDLKFFPNVPGPEMTKRLRLESDAKHYIKVHGSKEAAAMHLSLKCRTCSVDDCRCENQELIKIIENL